MKKLFLRDGKSIPGHPGYTITTSGLIFSNFRKRILGPWLNNYGYYVINLRIKRFLVHRLLAMTFIPNPHRLPYVNHKNGIKTDNRIDNLEWCDHAYNMRHASKHNLLCREFANPSCKLADKDVVVIRSLKGIATYKEIAKRYSVSASHVSDIMNGRKRIFV